MSQKRFQVALSFPGEHRDYVLQVAERLVETLGHPAILYDAWYKAEFTLIDLDTYLAELYHKQSKLLVPFLCTAYNEKEWCGLEWRAIKDLLKQKQYPPLAANSKTKLLRHWLNQHQESIGNYLIWSFYSQGTSDRKQVSATPLFTEAGEMRLHRVDYHLEMVRLLTTPSPQPLSLKRRGAKDYGTSPPRPIRERGPGGEGNAQHHFAEAERLITQTGYHRRRSELANLRATLEQSPGAQ